jgi:hypothetical protein
MILEQMTQSEFNALLDPVEQYAIAESERDISDAIHYAINEGSNVWGWGFMRSITFLHYARDNHPSEYAEAIDVMDCMGEGIDEICFWVLFTLIRARIEGIES